MLSSCWRCVPLKHMTCYYNPAWSAVDPLAGSGEDVVVAVGDLPGPLA